MTTNLQVICKFNVNDFNFPSNKPHDSTECMNKKKVNDVMKDNRTFSREV